MILCIFLGRLRIHLVRFAEHAFLSQRSTPSSTSAADLIGMRWVMRSLLGVAAGVDEAARFKAPTKRSQGIHPNGTNGWQPAYLQTGNPLTREVSDVLHILPGATPAGSASTRNRNPGLKRTALNARSIPASKSPLALPSL